MDLLALATSPDDQVCLWRLSWQKLFAFTPEEKVTALAWRPDGKVLTLGLSDGTITLINIETGEAFLHQVIAAHTICSLAWTALETPRQPAWLRRPDLRSNPQQKPHLGIPTPSTASRPKTQHAILCTMDASGLLQLMTADLFKLANVPLLDFSSAAHDSLKVGGRRYDQNAFRRCRSLTQLSMFELRLVALCRSMLLSCRA